MEKEAILNEVTNKMEDGFNNVVEHVSPNETLSCVDYDIEPIKTKSLSIGNVLLASAIGVGVTLGSYIMYKKFKEYRLNKQEENQNNEEFVDVNYDEEF